jgi:phosphatidylglycerol:prolipoprotein diacylglycerol transferase
VAVLIFIFFYRKKKRFDGELITVYMMGYGIGRLLIEQIRTDSLMIGPFKVSQVVAVACILAATIIFIKHRHLKYPDKTLEKEDKKDKIEEKN